MGIGTKTRRQTYRLPSLDLNTLNRFLQDIQLRLDQTDAIAQNPDFKGQRLVNVAQGFDAKDVVVVEQADATLAAHMDATDPHTVYQLKSEKSQANGYASLDSSGTVPIAELPSILATDAEVTAAIAAHTGAADPHTGYQKESEKDAANGYAGLNASSRITKGAITTDDLIVNLATKGLVLKDTQGTPHYWRVTANGAGGLTVSDIGTAAP